MLVLSPTVIDHPEIHVVCIKSSSREGRITKETGKGSERTTTERSLSLFFQLFRHLRHSRPEVLVSRDFGFMSFVLRLLTPIISKTTRFVVYAQVPVDEKLSEFDRSRKRFVLAQLRRGLIFRGVTVMTPVLSRRVRVEPFPDLPHNKGNYHFVPFVIKKKTTAARAPQPQQSSRATELRILHVGKWMPYKNHEDAIQALYEVRQETGTPMRMTLVGQAYALEHFGYRRQLEQLSEQLDLVDVVEFKTNIPYAEMRAIYDQHDVYLHTSHREVASVALLEAQATGLVAIVANNNGTNGYITEGQTGFSYQPTGAPGLAETLRAVSYKWVRSQLAGIEASNRLDYICSEKTFIACFTLAVE